MNRLSSALLVTGLVAASLLIATPAFAHDELIDSTPAAGETLTALPDAFSITMNEDLLDLDDEGSGFGILIRDSDGLYYGDGCVSVDGPTMSAEAVLGKPGEYTFIWQVVSSDGHPTSDEFTFEWAPEGEFAAAAGSEEPGDCNGQYVRDAPENAAEPDGAPLIPILGVMILGIAIIVLIAWLATRKRP
jgi:methionine-rich copper-binding protein CopC